MALSNQPPKGTSDWLPEEFKVRQYIFDIWRRTCQSFGYEEYLTPLLEAAEIYRAKSGEVGERELLTVVDAGGRELSLRPEMTPSVTRLVSRIYESVPKPIRFFSIANFWRNEKPQRGRNREFWQLNCDIFGSSTLAADLEIMQLALEIMLAFGVRDKSFVLNINNRQLIDAALSLAEINSPQQKVAVSRVLDKWQKLSLDEVKEELAKLGVSPAGQDKLLAFLQAQNQAELVKVLPELADNQGLGQIKEALERLTALGYGDWVSFQPGVIRGFDYYNGLVFEMFDLQGDNKRALFGGGRYNGLADLFGASAFPAVGIAPGDETTRIFLESRGLLEKISEGQTRQVYYLPLLEEKLRLATAQLARQLRAEGRVVVCGLEEQNISKALSFANKNRLAKVVILGEAELAVKTYKIKDMESGEQEEQPLLWR